MNISDFEKTVSQVILDRGYLYYRDDKIECCSRNADEFIFDVSGTENYQVIVQVDEDNNIKNSRCNCPYDITFTCKHEVAAYYKIRETVECLAEKIYRDIVFEQETKSLVENYKENLENIEKNKEEHVRKIRELLETYSKEKLLDILLEIVEENGAVRERFLKEIERKEALQLDEREVLTNYNEKIDKLFLEYEELEEQGIEDYENGYSYGRNYWEEYDDDYVDTDELKDRISETLNDVDGLLNNFECLKISIKLLEGIDKLNKLTETTSYHEVWEIVIDYFKEKLASVENLSITSRQEIFNRINKLNVKVSNRYEIAVDIEMLVQFCGLPGAKQVLLSKLNFISELYYDESINNRTAELIYKIYKKTNDEKGLVQSLKTLLRYESIRDIYISKLERNNNIENILEATKPWSENGKYRKKWLEYRLQIFKKLDNNADQKKTLERLVLLGEFSYYDELKNIHKDDFDKYYQKLLKKSKKKKEIWCGIIVRECDAGEMLSYLREYPNEISEYASIIKNVYLEEAKNMYMDYIFEMSEPVADRSHYRNICKYIVKYKNLFGLEDGIALVDYLDDKYKRRHSFRHKLREILDGYK
ncbi:hypothetical protein [uncultured Gemella sp.]|uniref:SWIM zinc finger family protein n=1 Tax=uncultured Gemella sp. TaxID=254352 RepID=UPI0028D1E49C|nr:hypothetical protein [uncultured Gemella sp.]